MLVVTMYSRLCYDDIITVIHTKYIKPNTFKIKKIKKMFQLYFRFSDFAIWLGGRVLLHIKEILKTLATTLASP